MSFTGLHHLRAFLITWREETNLNAFEGLQLRTPQGRLCATFQRGPTALPVLTEEVVHHLRCMVRSGGNPQELLPPGHRGVVDGLDIDVMCAH